MPVVASIATRAPLPGEGPAAPRIFHGWRVLGVMFAAQAFTIGTTSYAYSLFLAPIAEDLGGTRFQLSLGQVGLLLLQMLLVPLLGVQLDRRSIRALVAAGGLSFGTGLALMAAAPSLLAVGLVYWLVVSLGVLLAGPLPAGKLVASWFVRMRGRALGLAAVGTSAGGVVIPPLAAALIAWLGWRGALAALGAVSALVIVSGALWAIFNRPEDLGLAPDGAVREGTVPDPVEHAGVRPRDLVLDRSFWGIALCFGLSFAVSGGFFSYLGLYARDRGIEPGQTASLLAAISIGSALGKLFFGAAAERVEARKLVWLALACQALFYALLRMQPGYPLLLAGTSLAGLALGGGMPMHGVLTAACWGRSSFASVMGSMGPVMTPLTMGLTALGGWIPDATGGYERLFEINLFLIALAALALGLARTRRMA